MAAVDGDHVSVDIADRSPRCCRPARPRRSAGLRGFAQLGGRLPLSPLRRLGARRTIVLTLIVAAVATLLLLISGHVVPAVLYSLLAGASIDVM